jgi:uncharacterized integral membrane protein (TIGR00698 family)
MEGRVAETTIRATSATRWDWASAWLKRPYRSLMPGLLFTAGVGIAALLLGALEKALFTYDVIEPLVLALIIGMLIRTFANVPAALEPGIVYAAKQVLEFAIVILGATLDLHAIIRAGWQLFLCVLIAVPLAICTGVFLGKRLTLGPKLAILIAVGNAVCGNSAIAAVAPAIRAKKQDVASSIALTAVIGVGVVLILQVVKAMIGLTDYQYGVFAGMSVYAVPQVLAATFPVSTLSGQVGTLVKLTRVLLLGPIVAFFAFMYRNEEGEGTNLTFGKLVPWFVTGFLLMAVLRTIGIISPSLNVRSLDASDLSRALTTLAMAGLGLGVNVRTVRTVGPRVAVEVVGSLLLLMTLSLAAIYLLHLHG